MSDLLRLFALALLSCLAVALSSGPPAGAAASAQCTQDWRPAVVAAYLTTDGLPTDPPQPLPPAPSAQHRPFHVFCGTRYVNTVWWLAPTTVREAVRVAHELIAHARYPSVHLGVNPVRGITGLATWCWAAPDPNPVLMLRGNGPAIDIELRVTDLKWSFGDTPGTTASGLGVPYPQPSPVAHVYERKGAYTVTGNVQVLGRYWYEELLEDVPGANPVATGYEVAEVRSLLHAA